CVLLIAACGGTKPTTHVPVGDDTPMLSEKRLVISHGRKSGNFELTRQADGSFKVFLDILENGRGPHVDGTLRIDDAGFLTAFTAKGHYTFGTAIDEHFSREGDAAQWKSNEEQGDT